MKPRANQTGTSLAEMPVALTVFFLFLIFPLMDLATIALRSATAYSAAFNAAHAAALSRSFLSDVPITDPQGVTTISSSSVNSAVKAAMATKAAGLAGTEFTDTDIKIRIVGLPLDPSAGLPTLQGLDRQPLVTIDPAYVYEIEVSIAAKIQPLFSVSNQVFGDVTGLTIPIPLTVTGQQVCENTRGLNH